MDIFFWLFFGAVAGFTILIVVLMLLFIAPARNSPAIFFIKAKRKKKTVLMMDNGSHWRFMLSDHEGRGVMTTNDGSAVFIAPNSVKYGLGVRVAVGEAHRNVTADPGIVEVLNHLHKSRFKPGQVRSSITAVENKEGYNDVPEKGKYRVDGRPVPTQPTEQPEPVPVPRQRGRPTNKDVTDTVTYTAETGTQTDAEV